jgi:type IV pilus assembly protein PilC
MAKYYYKAVHTSGEERTGIVEAIHEANAADIIREMGYYPIRIREVSERAKKREIEWSYRIKTSDLAVFCSQFAVVLKAGVSILQALDILSTQSESRKLKNVLIDVQSKIQKGSSVTEAFSEHARRFPDLFLSMLETGEASGNMDIVLGRMGVSLNKEHKLNQKVRSAMIYPVILSVVAMLVVVFLLVAVVPTFSSMYAATGQKLPLLTSIMLALGDFMANHLPVIILTVVSILIIARILLKTERIRLQVDRYKLRMPIFGKLLLKVITARFTQTMATLLSSGISLPLALSITSKSVGNHYVGLKISSLINEVRSGKGLSDPLSELGIFPPMVIQMTRLGEESGAIDELLTQTSDFYESEAESATTKMTALIEPLVIVFMGGVVLLIVLSILLPMFGIYSMI